MICNAIKYVKSDGNYLEIHHDHGKAIIRESMDGFFKLIPDPFEYIRVRRSHIVRIDRIEKKSKREIYINGEAIQIGKTYIDTIAEIKI